MENSIRAMVELGKKKRTVACAFDWPGWDRSGRSEEDALRLGNLTRPVTLRSHDRRAAPPTQEA